jgi:predicted component of type VI protein secretion system
VARLLIIDEALNPRLATELRRRGRHARSAAQLGYKGLRDPELLRAIAQDHPDAVLVTSDDHMPADHPEHLRRTGLTIATIDPARPRELTQEQWEFDVVQRWAHKMTEQEPGSWRRYGRSARDWTSPRRVRRPRP